MLISLLSIFTFLLPTDSQVRKYRICSALNLYIKSITLENVFLTSSLKNYYLLKEKITLGISLLLSLVVFLTMLVKKFLPPTSLAFPLIAKYLVFTFVMNLASMATSVYVINVNYRETCDMPNRLKWVFLVGLPWMLFMGRPRKYRYYTNQRKQPYKPLLVIKYF